MSAEEGLLHFFSFRKKRWPDDFVSSPSARKHSSPVFFSRPSSPTNSPVASDEFSSRFAAADAALAFHTSRTPLVCTNRVLTELRAQFTEQSKCLDAKLDVDSTVLAELQEFYRRRAIVEQDYSDALAKLANSLKHKHLAETGKRPNWANYTTTSLWNTLLGSTLRLSQAHSTLSEVYSKQMIQRLIDMDEDAFRLHRQCREMMHLCQEKVLTNTLKLHSDQREYGQRQNAQLEAERVVRRSDEKLMLALQHARAKKKRPEDSQRCRRAKAEFDQKKQLFDNAVVATNRARNEYLIQLAAANQSIARYFGDEVSDVIDCMNCGLHNSLARAAMMHLSCEEAIKGCHNSICDMINGNITALDWRRDKTLFLRRNEVAFAQPPSFTFMPFKEDNESEVSTVTPLRDSLMATASDLRANLESLKASTEEAWSKLQEIEKRLLLLINQNDYDVSELFVSSAGKERPRRSESLTANNPITSPTVSAVASTQVPIAGNVTAASSSSSIPLGMNKVGVGGGVASTQSSDGLAGAAVTGSQSSMLSDTGSGGGCQQQSGNGEAPQGLYLSLRASYRDERIKEERVYMERFRAYTQDMHRYYVMQAKLAEIEKALTKGGAAATAPSIVPAPPDLQFPSLGVPILRPGDSPGDISVFGQMHAASQLMALSAATAFDAGSASSPVEPTPVSLPLTPPPPPPPNPPGSSASPASMVRTAPRRVLRVPNVGRPKLFGGSIDEYVEATKEAIPRIVLSCIRAINLYGMHHQGIFRVSGSQAEILAFKTAFEQGEDPLIGHCDARDINSTAGLLKLYFRELGEPPFPNAVFMDLVTAVRERRDIEDGVQKLREIVRCGLSSAVFVVMRYLFAFLHHLAEYSDENMMDPYNLAICFGPTLMPAPPGLDQVEYQTSVNEVVKTFIAHHTEIFDQNVPGPRYEKYTYIPQVLARLAVEVHHNRRMAMTDSSTTTAETGEGTASRADGAARTSGKNPSSTAIGGNDRSHPHRISGGLTDLSSSVDQLSLDEGTLGDLAEGDEALQSDSESEGSSDDSPILNSDLHGTVAIAQADFTGNSPRELSFRRGAEILLYRQLNDHWWEGQLASETSGPRYLVPSLYVAISSPTPAPPIPLRPPTSGSAGVAPSAAAVTVATAAPAQPPIIKPPRITRATPISKNCRPLNLGSLDLGRTGDDVGSRDERDISTGVAVSSEPFAGDRYEVVLAAAKQEVSPRTENDEMPAIMSNSVSVPRRVTSLGDQDSVPRPISMGRCSPVASSFDTCRQTTLTITQGADSSVEGMAATTQPTFKQRTPSPERSAVRLPPVLAPFEIPSDSCSLIPPSSSPTVGPTTLGGVVLRASPALVVSGTGAQYRCSWAGPTTHSATPPVSNLTPLPEENVGLLRSSVGDEQVTSKTMPPERSVDRSWSMTEQRRGSLTAAMEPFVDIDSVLAEVMNGLASMEKERNSVGRADSLTSSLRARELEKKMRMPLAKHTPDLVLDLPPTEGQGSPTGSESSEVEAEAPSKGGGSSPAPRGSRGFASLRNAASAADTFAEQGLGTVRKRCSIQNVISLSTPSQPPAVAPAPSKVSPPQTPSPPPPNQTPLQPSCLIRKSLEAGLFHPGGRGLGPSVLSGEPAETTDVTTTAAAAVPYLRRRQESGGETKDIEDDKVTATAASSTVSPPPVKKGSIAARVAAFEASSSQSQTRSVPWARKA
ncbi:SLIT-ROBO Rho GTPase-activating protein 3 [Sparganum proliferum]